MNELTFLVAILENDCFNFDDSFQNDDLMASLPYPLDFETNEEEPKLDDKDNMVFLDLEKIDLYPNQEDDLFKTEPFPVKCENLIDFDTNEKDNVIFLCNNEIETLEEVVGEGIEFFDLDLDKSAIHKQAQDEMDHLSKEKSKENKLGKRSRKKKKEQMDYVILDMNSSGDDKTEYIKYVGKGSYKCQICDIYSKNNKDYIQDHINIKHYNIKKNYECLLCNITFAWRSGAFKHLKKYHSIEGKNTIHYFRAISKRHVYHSQRKRN